MIVATKPAWHVHVAAIFGAALFAATVTADEAKDETPIARSNPRVAAQLSISVDEFDPVKPEGTMKCIVRNGLDKNIEIPERYDGQRIALIAESHRWPLRLWDRTRDRKEPPSTEIKPASEKTAFEFPLAEILRVQAPETVREDFEAGRPVIVWDWNAHPRSPPSPIHTTGGRGFVEKVTFWVELTVEGTTVSSNKVVLKVKK